MFPSDSDITVVDTSASEAVSVVEDISNSYSVTLGANDSDSVLIPDTVELPISDVVIPDLVETELMETVVTSVNFSSESPEPVVTSTNLPSEPTFLIQNGICSWILLEHGLKTYCC